jgi:adenosylcobinamide-GDP ribazoletransferase
LEKLIENLALTLAFFSRIPLPASLGNRISHDAKIGEAAAFFPIAGLIISLPIALVWFVSSSYLPATIAAGLAIGLSLLITGGLHEDGFADCADGLGATPNRERALEIMRDSRIGTYGSLALILSIGLRWAALASLGPLSGVFAIIICNVGARSAMTIAMQFSNYARPEGLGKQANTIRQSDFIAAIIIASLIAILCGWFWGFIALSLAYIAAWLFLKRLEHRLGGYTGDGLGAMEQIAEITILITLAGAWS